MTKHRRTRRTTRRSQKGGLFGFGEPADPNAPGFFSKLMGYGSTAVKKTQEGINSLESGLGNLGTKVGEGFNSINPFGSENISPATSTSTVPPATYSTQGGRGRKRAISMRGGKGGLGFTYYAAPVSGLKVAEPTSWQYYANGTNQYSVKGGSRKRRGRKSCRTRRYKRR
jgi:hypothetical protein